METGRAGPRQVGLITWGLGLRLGTWARELWRFTRRKPLGGVSLVFLVAMVLVAIFSPWITPHSPYENIRGAARVAPGATYWFGTDHLGRDLFSRVLIAGRISLFIGLVVMLLGTTVGSAVGVFSAYIGGKTDLIIQRIVDGLLAFPAIILALALMATLGQSLLNVILALVVVNTPRTIRTVRSAALSIKENVYVDAARSIGASNLRVMFLHVTPNCFAPIIIMATVTLGWAILAEASLSFLGLGVPADVPTWGGMLGTMAQRFMRSAPWTVVFPGLTLTLVVMAINLLGDAMRDMLDPRLRGAR
ncbi:MAG: ABC transporter permease [Chloroflexota bacterium]|nr:ABC transporter permease [Chloroflexota bacterium]